MAEYLTNTTDLTKVASAIREKGGTSDPLVYPDGFVTAIQAIQTGGSSTPGTLGDITFYDYDGTIVTSWTLSELATKTALPDYPSHNGLICQGWNWSLADLKTANRKMSVGAMYITDDGKTRIYIHLEEGRTSPVLGVCPKGTVDVDWGDGTVHGTLTGSSTSTAVYTSAHHYAAPGDYVIQLTVTGSMGFRNRGPLMYASTSDNINRVYGNAIRKVELGSGVTSIGGSAFQNCCSLSSITIPDSVTRIDSNAFQDCYSLLGITIPDSVTSIGNSAFNNCYSLSSITIPDSVTSISTSAFSQCYSLSSITIPNSVTRIGNSAFYNCYSLSSITIPDSVTRIDNVAFYNCYGMRYYDFSACTAIPSLSNTNAFNNIPSDCQMLIPSSLYNNWKAATNWATYASKMVSV